MSIEDLELHPAKYVSVEELAVYWQVSRKMLYKQIDAGQLPAERIGRLLRVRTTAAKAFARAARIDERQTA